jgi:modulator of FtsH protease
MPIITHQLNNQLFIGECFVSEQNTFGYSVGNSLSSALATNRVLRNTFALLALTMVPTVLGAWIGVTTGFSFFKSSPFMGMIVFLAVAFGFFWAIEKNKNSGTGVVLLFGFTFFMGLMLTGLLTQTLQFRNGAQLIMMAFGATGLIFAGMATWAATSKSNFDGLGKFLFIGVILLILASVANIFLSIPALSLSIMVIAVGIFSAFILYDVKRIVNGGETNYVMATLSIYLNVYNVFSNLLALFGIFGGDRD